jgi:hypothetical protein
VGVRTATLVVLGTAALAAAPASARAQELETSYAGGAPAVPGGGGSVAVTLRQGKLDRIAFRFETTLRCGDERVEVTAQSEVQGNGFGFAAGGAVVRELVTGRTVRAPWSIAGHGAGIFAGGSLSVAVARVRGRRCRPAARRLWQVRAVQDPEVGPAVVRPLATLAGGVAPASPDALPAPLVLRVRTDGRGAIARWSVAAACPRATARTVAVDMPAITIRGGVLTGRRRGTVRTATALLRYTADLEGSFAFDGAAGTLRLRVRVLDTAGRRVRARCDSGPQRWVASTVQGLEFVVAAPGAPLPGPLLGPAQRATWSLQFSGDPDEFVSAGRAWSYAPPTPLILRPDRRQIVFYADFSNASWRGAFAAPPGGVLRPGTYTGALRWPFNPQIASMAFDGGGNGCNELSGTFTIQRFAFDGYALRARAALRAALRVQRAGAARDVHVPRSAPPGVRLRSRRARARSRSRPCASSR